ncbi:MAG: hypothetical protein ACPLPR_03530 [Bacillota bacterium]
MRLLVNNQEVPLHRTAAPPVDAFRAVCQLVGVPFREEQGAGVFAAFPPLLGRRVILWLCEGSEEGAGLAEGLREELKLLQRLLWICGADTAGWLWEPPREGDRAAWWDAGIVFHPGALLAGRIDPVMVIRGLEYPIRSRRLRWCIASSWGAAGMQPVRKTSALLLPRALRRWVNSRLCKVPAPCVMIAMPMVTGYTEHLLERLAGAVCQGILMYFGKPMLSPGVPEMIRGSQVKPATTAPQKEEPSGSQVPVAVSPAPEARAVPVKLEEEPQRQEPPDDGRERMAWQFLSAKGFSPSKELVAEYLAYLERVGKKGQTS